MDKSNPGFSFKCDVILSGQEAFGSAERSCDTVEMRNQFNTVSDGQYAKTLYGRFTKERVEKEMGTYLNHKFIERCGGGIGLDRLIRSLKMNNLMPDYSKKSPSSCCESPDKCGKC